MRVNSKTSIFSRLRLGLLLAAAFATATAWGQEQYSSGPGFSQSCDTRLARPTETVVSGVGKRISFIAGPTGKRDFHSITDFKMMSFNVLNLESSPGRYETDATTGERRFVPQHITLPEQKTRELAETILAEDPDVVTLLEVESLSAASSFAKQILQDKYFVILVPGNDNRVNIAFLVKKDLPFDVTVQSHTLRKHQYRGQNQATFTRDFPVLEFRKMGSSPRSAPAFLYAGVHLKSQRVPDDSDDPRAEKKRKAQVEEMIHAIAAIKRKYGAAGEQIPVFLAGDFNADLKSDPEFQALRDAGYQDSFDLAGIPADDPRRVTHSFFKRRRDGSFEPPKYNQLDGIFYLGPPNFRPTSIRSVPYKDTRGRPKPLPTTLDEREENPSDHFALSLAADLSWIFRVP